MACILVLGARGHNPRRVKKYNLCLSIPINSLWEALNVKARSPDKFKDVTSVKVSDEDGFLVRNMTLTPNNTTVRERIWIDRFAQRGCV